MRSDVAVALCMDLATEVSHWNIVTKMKLNHNGLRVGLVPVKYPFHIVRSLLGCVQVYLCALKLWKASPKQFGNIYWRIATLQNTTTTTTTASNNNYLFIEYAQCSTT